MAKAAAMSALTDFVAEVSDQQNVAFVAGRFNRQLPPVPLGAVP